MKIAIIGGHLTPALSIIEALPKDAQIIYIGRKRALEGDQAVSLEYKTITEMGIKFSEIITGRLQRKITLHTIPSLAKTPAGFVKSLSILLRFNPDVVVGFGGYVSFPVTLAAYFLKIPVIIHEQTLEAGASNKLISKFADKVCVSFISSEKYFPKYKTVLTGNPIRKSILSPSKKFEIEGDDPVIYITGGSLGSHVLNLSVSQILPKLLEKFRVIHQVGSAREFRDFEKLSILRDGLNWNKKEKYVISEHFSPSEIGSILRVSDLVVARSGINTVSELIVLRKPALLIPLPVSQKDEQVKNAMFFEKLGLGEVMEQKDLSLKFLLETVNKMVKNIEGYQLKSDSSHFPKNAAQRIVEIIYAAGKNKN